MNTACPDLRGKQRTKAVPPIPHGLMTHVDAPFVKQVFDLPQGERKSNLQHHRKTDGLGRCLEVFEFECRTFVVRLRYQYISRHHFECHIGNEVEDQKRNFVDSQIL